MRKVNRNSTKIQSKSFNKTTGCDVDSEIVVIANYDRNSESIDTVEFRNNYLGAIQAVKYIKDFGSELVILESTANYHILFYDVFKLHHIPAKILNPLLVSALLKVEGKNDKGDARTLARLGANFDLKTSNMPDPLQRQIRMFLRSLDKWKMRRTQITNRINSTLTANGCNLFRVTKVNSKSGISMVEAIIDGKEKGDILLNHWFGKDSSLDKIADAMGELEMIPNFVKPFLQDLLDELIFLNSKIEKLETQSLELISDLGLTEFIANLCTAPAMSNLLALRIIGEMGLDFTDRYSSGEKFVKAIGVCPNNIVSGGKVLKKNSSHGNIHLKVPLLNAVKSYCNKSKDETELKKFFLNYRAKSSYKKATSAVARRLMTMIYAMVRDNKPFNSETKRLHKPRKVYVINKNKME